MSGKNFNLGVVAVVGGLGIIVGGLGAKFLLNSGAQTAAAGANTVTLSSELATDQQKQSYSLGVVIGQQVQSSLKMASAPLDNPAFLNGFGDVIQGNEPKLANDDIYKNVNNLQESANKAMTTSLETKALTKQSDLFTNSSTPHTGNGDVTVVEFFDYNCPHCRSLNKELSELVNNQANVKVIYRPIGLITKGSEKAAITALAANKQNKFKVVHEAFMAYENELTEDAIKSIVSNLNLDQAKLVKDMENSEVANQATKNRKIFLELGLRGVPSLFAAKLDATNKVKNDTLIYVSGDNSAAIKESLNRLN